MTTYNASLRPLHRCMQLVGVLPCVSAFESPRGRRDRSPLRRWTYRVWRWTHLLVVLGLLLWLNFGLVLSCEVLAYPRTDHLSRGLDRAGYVSLLVVHVCIQLESVAKQHYHTRIFQMIDRIRVQLRHDLDCAFDLGRNNRCIWSLYALLLFYVLVYSLLVFLAQWAGYHMPHLMFTLFSAMLLHVKLIEFALYVAVVVAYMQQICAAGRKCVAALEESRFEVWSVRRGYLVRIGVLQDVHGELWLAIRHIEDYFQWSLPMLLLKIFFDLTVYWYWVFFNIQGHSRKLLVLFCVDIIVMQSLFLYVVCYLCSVCEQLAKSFCSLFFGLTGDRRNPFLGASLRRISLQLMHEPVRFTAGGFVVVNTHTYGQFVFAVISYVVILIQFRISL